MKSYAVAIITGKTEHGLLGKFLESGQPRVEWQTFEIRHFAPVPAAQDGRAAGVDDAKMEQALAAFEALMAAPPVGSLVAMTEAHGYHNDATQQVFAGGFEFIKVCDRQMTDQIVGKFTDPRGGVKTGQIVSASGTSQVAALFQQIPGFVSDPNQLSLLHLVGGSAIEHEGWADAASREPDEAIIWVSGAAQGAVLAHRGAYLFGHNEIYGTDLISFGFSKLPDTEGLYYVAGTPWAHVPGDPLTDDYASGFEIETCVPATAEHLARFGVEPDGFAADIEDLEREYASGMSPAR